MHGVRVGQIGVGAVGYHFAAHLARHFQDVTVYDIDPQRRAEARSLGVVVADGVPDFAACCDIIVLSLPSPATVRNVVEELLEHTRSDTLIVDCSTIDPETARAIGNRCEPRGVRYVEAPVTSAAPGGGSTEGARQGNLTFLVGGEHSAVQRAAPLFEILGERYVHLGPVGAGSTMKLVTNQVSGVITLAVAEGLVLAAAAGFPLEQSIDVISRSVAGNYVLDHIMADRLRNDDYEPGFAVDLMHKDHVLAGELGRRLTVPLPFNQLAGEVFQMMRSRGLGARDHVICAKFLADLAGVELER